MVKLIIAFLILFAVTSCETAHSYRYEVKVICHDTKGKILVNEKMLARHVNWGEVLVVREIDGSYRTYPKTCIMSATKVAVPR